ncbi:zinc-binding dehydrogenase [Dactylosporangium sp. NPDC005572]|uniref:zinc-binding dehydrogenase n=1 Tax=Dactylosporangium sp. NPDC005572 TaxID=3156889 RepID=UPI0033AD57B6
MLVEVHAAGVTYPDLLLAWGKYQARPDLPFVLGTQFAGRVAWAPASSAFAVGQRVGGFSLTGGFAEWVACDEANLLVLPDGCSWQSAAASLTNYLTAHFLLVERAGVRSGERVLIHGAGGGLGLAAVQVARCLGADVLAVTSSDAKSAAAHASGATTLLPADGFAEWAAAGAGAGSVDVVVDPVGGDRFTDSVRCLAPGGRLIVAGFASGSIPTVAVNRLLLRNVAVIGGAWGPWARVHPGFVQRQWQQLTTWFTTRQLRPVVSEVLPLHDVAHALGLLDDRKSVGNVVLRIR